MSLLWRIFVGNAIVLAVATTALALMLLNYLLLRRAVAPVQRLALSCERWIRSRLDAALDCRIQASGYVLKSGADRDLVEACRAAVRGEPFLYPAEQIAELLVISPRTVDRHRENILAKLGMRDRVELTRHAIRRGLVGP